MELRIKCDAKVDLVDFVNLLNVMCEVNEYELKDETLNGYVCVKGKYIKDDLHQEYDFLENVPFTVVFNANSLSLDKIEVEDLVTTEIINHGLECKFNIVITYSEIAKDLNEDDILIKSDEIKEDLPETNNDFISSNDEELKTEINQKYDELLNKILSTREEDIELEENEEKEENIEKNIFNISTSENKLRPVFTKFSDSYTSYHVYYPKQESELESICNKEKISIDRIYSDNANKDFKDKKRIIIK